MNFNCVIRRLVAPLRLPVVAAVLVSAVLISGVLTGCARSTSTPAPLPDVSAVLGAYGKRPGSFVSPRAIAYDSRRQEICVVDRSGRIQRFGRAETDGGEPGEWKILKVWSLPDSEKGQPTGLHFDRSGRLLVADTHYQRILRYDVDTGALLSTFGGEGTGDGEFGQIRDVVEDRAGHLYAGDYGDFEERVVKFDEDGNFVLSFGKRGEGPAEFQRIQGMAVAIDARDQETLLVVDSCNHRVQRFTLDGQFLSSWGSPGRLPGQLRYPYGICVEPRPGGDIFVVEWGNNRIQRFDSDGRSRGCWGRAGRETGELATPWDVEWTAGGMLCVADFGNHRVQVFQCPDGLAATGSGPAGSILAETVLVEAGGEQ
jgi:hypothetical protein